EVFVREHAVEMRSVADRGKKEQRAYVESLPGITPYVASQVNLLCFGIHAIPVDDKLIGLLVEQEVTEPGVSPAEVESAMLRQIKASDAADAYHLLQTWADEHAGKSKGSRRKKSAATKSTAKRAARKKTTRKKAATRKKTATRSKKK
ncbi:MAG: hypothetical protein MI741_00155, partial [Rhodospirillales bacterium]|nr:hypothetical protein [Rhodospirillales bacterium]